MIALNIPQICQTIINETNKYNKAAHQLYKTHKDNIKEFTIDLVPEDFSTSKRIDFIIALSKDENMLTRYVGVCIGCNAKFKKLKKFSSVCIECNTKGSDYLENVKRDIAIMGYASVQSKYDDPALIEGYDYLICGECGSKSSDLSAHIIKRHNMTIDEYKSKYKVLSIKCGKVRENLKGENNPAYQHGGRLSPFSKKFINPHNKDYSNLIKVATQTRLDNHNDNTKIEYWLKKTDGDVVEAKELLSNRQRTFSLDICIEKYGQEEGQLVWKNRQEKWHKSFKKSNFSKISQELFWGISEGLISLNDIFFAELDNDKKLDGSGRNHELRLTLDSVILPDFIDVNQKKVIEFDGSYWHGVIGHGNKERESIRDSMLHKYGYEVLHIGEIDYKNDKDGTIISCINFLIQ